MSIPIALINPAKHNACRQSGGLASAPYNWYPTFLILAVIGSPPSFPEFVTLFQGNRRLLVPVVSSEYGFSVGWSEMFTCFFTSSLCSGILGIKLELFSIVFDF